VPLAVQKQLNRSICRLGCGLEWAEGCTSSIVFARWRQCDLIGGHVAVTCRITMNHPSMRRGALSQITLTTCYLWTRPLTQSHRQPSASSRVLYCGHSTQYSHLVEFLAPSSLIFGSVLTTKSFFCGYCFHFVALSCLILW